ncbi:SCO3242 family prenyltransferase [Nonomuraea bangladeshensis]|uniref:SCO3242 family prenyltransferase n=1 Tax=Nonomuraea bangladeshensis TaxID=404385 RepID=UPI003C2B3653
MRALLELVRAPAALSVPGDTLAGAAAAGRRPAPGLALASVLMYWSGMALNDWADRETDAAERPERPIPSGRVRPGAALGLAAALTGAGLASAALAGGRRGLTVAGLLAGAVWAYDLGLKRTAAGPASMAACRVLDVLLGAGEQAGAAVPAALAIGAHTYGISVLGRAEVTGAARGTAERALVASAAAAGLAAAACARDRAASCAHDRAAACVGDRAAACAHDRNAARAGAGVLIAGYLAFTLPVQAGLRTRPEPEHVRQAVRLGILGLIPLQAAAVAGGGRFATAGALLCSLPLGKWLSNRMATS